MATQWYYSKAGQRQGPVASEKLKELAASGQIALTDLIWKEGMAQWVEAKNLKGLFPATVAASPPAPPALPAAPAMPNGTGTPSLAADNILFCPKCGQKNNAASPTCTRCGFALQLSPQPLYTADDGTMGGLIPYKNKPALIAYYFGVFSLIPCLGIPLGITALVLGIKGLRYAARNPQARGGAHAWVGIILGSLCAVGYTLLVVLPFLLPVLLHHDTLKPLSGG